MTGENVTASQRFTTKNPCPICGGGVNDKHGLRVRCWGFLSKDGAFAHCTRPEHAGSLTINPSTEAYVHKVVGECRCGVPHGDNGVQDAIPDVKSKSNERLNFEDEYIYRDAEGRPLHRVLRFEGKAWRQQGWVNGGWQSNKAGVTAVLYRLPELVGADPEEPVFLVEGEKDVDRLIKEGFVATTNSSGVRGWEDRYAESLRDRHVIVIGDNDDEGRRGAQDKYTSLTGVARSVRNLVLGGLPDKGDVSDWLDMGHGKEELATLAREMLSAPDDVKLAAELENNEGKGDHEKMVDALKREFGYFDDTTIDEQPPLTWIIDGILPSGAIAVLYGKAGIGKSFLALDWAYSSATNTRWLGREVVPGPCLYITVEGVRGIPKRRAAWKQAHGKYGEAAVTFITRGKDLRNPQDCAGILRFIQTVMTETPTLIVIDTLARFFGSGDENQAREMNLFLNGLNQIQAGTGATILVLHHTGKEGDEERGSSALRGGADTMLFLKAKEGKLTLASSKPRDFDPFDPITYRHLGVTLPNGETSAVIESEDTVNTKVGATLTGKTRIAFNTLRDHFPNGATNKEWLERSGLDHSSLSRAIKKLVESGVVVHEGTGVGSKYFVAKEFVAKKEASTLTEGEQLPLPSTS